MYQFPKKPKEHLIIEQVQFSPSPYAKPTGWCFFFLQDTADTEGNEMSLFRSQHEWHDLEASPEVFL